MRELVFIVPGRFATLTGGYGYDRRIVAGLRALGWSVTALDESKVRRSYGGQSYGDERP